MLRHCFKQGLLVFFASLMLMSTVGVGGLQTIGLEGLPRAAWLFINEMYPTGEVESVETEGVLFARVFKVRLRNGTMLEFDADGEWIEVKSEEGYVAPDIVPCPILYQLRATYPEVRIAKIERIRKGYDLVMANGVEIIFNRDYEIVS